jgi:phospholipase C
MQAAGTASFDQARELLAPIEHIVVVMLENRSFDHMLGYLAFPEHALPTHGANDFPSTVEGIAPGHVNYHAGNMYGPEPLDESVFSDNELDPPHDPQSAQAQIAGGSMSGFVTAFASSLEARNLADAASDQQVLKSVMSRTAPALVPVYDHLVCNFCVCDRWFCSIPGPTMPNRF